jgi:hypothetical protein
MPVKKPANPRTNAEKTNIYRALSTMFVGEFEQLFGTSLSWVKTRLPVINVRYLDDKGFNQFFLPPTLFCKGATVVFFCEKCLSENFMESVVIAKCDKSNGIASYSSCCLWVEEVYYHNCHKKTTTHSTKGEYVHNGFSVQKFPTSLMFGDCYNKAIARINSFTPPIPIIDATFKATLGDKLPDLLKEVKEKRGVTPLMVDDEDYNPVTFPEQPPGHRINFGIKNYDFDNRFYIGLPTVSLEFEVEKKLHLRCLARFGYYLCATFGIARQFSPFKFDHDTMANHRMMSNRVNWRKCFTATHANHLELRGVALLFGGQELRMRSDPIHQWVHRDTATKDSINECVALKGLIPPGSFIIPLELQRNVYVNDPAECVVEVESGEMMLFRGDLAHGGMTRSSNSWDVAIHGHLDSKFITRMQQKIEMETSLYFPTEMIEFQGHDSFFDYYEKQVKWTVELVGEATKRVSWLKNKTNKKNKHFQKILKELQQLSSLDFFGIDKTTKSKKRKAEEKVDEVEEEDSDMGSN